MYIDNPKVIDDVQCYHEVPLKGIVIVRWDNHLTRKMFADKILQVNTDTKDGKVHVNFWDDDAPFPPDMYSEDVIALFRIKSKK